MKNVINNIAQTNILPSNIHGLGLFAQDGIEVNTTLCLLDGQKVLFSDYKELTQNRDDLPFLEWNALTKELLLVRFFRTKYSFINHSRTPNCLAQAKGKSVIVSTIKDIQTEQELTLDYRNEPLPDEYLRGHGAAYL